MDMTWLLQQSCVNVGVRKEKVLTVKVSGMTPARNKKRITPARPPRVSRTRSQSKTVFLCVDHFILVIGTVKGTEITALRYAGPLHKGC